MDTENVRREGLALCLSGGGFRATLFHLGACRRLNELGLLTQLRSISSVSGGSLLAGFLATRLPWADLLADNQKVIPPETWDEAIGRPVRELCSSNLRSGPLFGSLLTRWMPWNWHKPGAVVQMADALEEPYQHRRLVDLPDDPQLPQFIFCATDLNFGTCWTFEKDRMGDPQIGYAEPPSDFSIAKAVAISACFPPVFAPYKLDKSSLEFKCGGADPQDKIAAKKTLRLNDGGNYDNFGLDPVIDKHELLLVSDAGAGGRTNPHIGWLEIMRFLMVIMTQQRAMRKHAMIRAFEKGEPKGAYWGVGSATSRYRKRLWEKTEQDQELLREVPNDYTLPFASKFIGTIRTDLDAFSTVEQGVLENHGYAMADVAVRAFVARDLVPNWDAPYCAPHSELVENSKLARELLPSRVINPLGRGILRVWQNFLDSIFSRPHLRR